MGSSIDDRFDVVIRAEQCRINDDGTATILSLPSRFQSVKGKGGFLRQGDLLTDAPTVLTAAHVVTMQYAGHAEVEVFSKPTLAIVPTGNDLRAVGETPLPGEYIECNSLYAKIVAERYGAQAEVYPSVRDSDHEIVEAIERAVSSCDFTVLIGGLGAKGECYRDHTLRAIRQLGEIITYGINIQPGGKVFTLACIEGKPVIGLPGPPHAAFTTIETFFPLLFDKLFNCSTETRPTVEARLIQGIKASGSKEHPRLMRMHVRREGDGYVAWPVENLGETVENFCTANASLPIYGGTDEFEEGKLVQVKLYVSTASVPRTTAS